MTQELTKDPARIVSQVEYEYGLKPGTLASRDRTPHVSGARRIAIQRLRKDTKMSFTEIGKMLRRDHTSVMALAKVAKTVGISSGKARGKPVGKKVTVRGKARG